MPPNKKTKQDRIVVELVKLRAGRGRILDLVVKGTITDAQLEKQLAELNRIESTLTADLERMREHLDKLPSPGSVKSLAARVAAGVTKYRYASAWLAAKKHHANHALDEMTWEEKRELVQMVFGGHLVDGRRMGIYLERIPGQEGRQHRQWRYTINGHLIDEDGFFPMSADRLKVQFQPGAPARQIELVTKGGRSSTPR